MSSLAFVTPTFTPDLERCELLVRSLDRFAPDIRHYLLVSSYEVHRFRHLVSSRTFILVAEDIIGLRQLRLSLRQNFWLNPRTLPMRGWIRQQILKLAVGSHVDEDVLICVDSDVAFIRQFDQSMLRERGKLGLLDVAYTDANLEGWTDVACRLLGLDRSKVTCRGYVGHLITWSRAHLRALQARVEDVTGLRWQVALGRERTFSEYVLYGVFIRDLLGYEHSQHAPSTRALVRQPWDHDLRSEAGLRRFVTEPEAENVAVMVHSKFDIPIDEIRVALERSWADSSQ